MLQGALEGGTGRAEPGVPEGPSRLGPRSRRGREPRFSLVFISIGAGDVIVDIALAAIGLVCLCPASRSSRRRAPARRASKWAEPEVVYPWIRRLQYVCRKHGRS